MSIGPIPFTAIAEYAKIYDVESFDDFIYIIRVMDNQFLKLHNNDAKNRKTDNTKSKTSRR